MTTSPPDDALLEELERTALELARSAGETIAETLGRPDDVAYKTAATGERPAANPVSEVDRRIEERLVAVLAHRFPDHAVLGEETAGRPGDERGFVWAIDPVDGTSNFVNGFPLCAASIGVLHAGVPVAGAIWCSTTHALRPGTYHGRLGGGLRFDGRPIEPRARRGDLRRELVGLGSGTRAWNAPWDVRFTGSAALECAFVAAGHMRAARLKRLWVWDVAAGIGLVREAGGEVLLGGSGGWERFERFEPPRASDGSALSLRDWHRPVLLGDPVAVAELREG